MKLTNCQVNVMTKDFPDGQTGFVLLQHEGEDRTARSLSKRGFGHWTNNGHRYPWRKRDGYYNLFTFSDEGLEVRKRILGEAAI